MSFLAPWMFVAGLLGAGAVVALHLLTTRRPPPVPLPTARFVPESEMRALARASRPTDVLLMALRALAMLAIGTAFAAPVLDAPGPRVRSVVLLEWTSALEDPERARSLARARVGEGDALVLFDTAARQVSVAALDSLTVPPAALRVARLSPALVAARDAAATIARGADSLRLVLVASAGAATLDAATSALRAEWPGRIEHLSLALAVDTAAAGRVSLVAAAADDPLAPAIEGLGPVLGTQEVRVLRRVATAADSAWARERPARLLVEWPLVADSLLAPDGVIALLPGVAASPTLVAPLARGDAGRGRVIARWRDGDPAATESALGTEGCIRSVGIGLPSAGDLTLRAPFAAFLDALLTPCGGRVLAPPADSALAWLTAPGPLATGRALTARADASPLTRWLLLVAAALLVAEQLLRARGRRAGPSAASGQSPAPTVARAS